jgi:hypothetical protein
MTKHSKKMYIFSDSKNALKAFLFTVFNNYTNNNKSNSAYASLEKAYSKNEVKGGNK